MFTPTAFSSQDIVRDGLVLWLDANDKTSYPGSGTAWRDLSLGGNNGTLINGPTFDSDNGGSIVFDGVNDYATTSFTLNGSQPLTVSCWFNLDTITKNWHSIIDAFKDNTDRNFQLWCDNVGKIRVYHLGPSHSGTYTLSPNTWYNAVFTYPGSGLGTLYVNKNITDPNVPKGSGSGGNIQLNIGRRTDAHPSSYTNGLISNIQIYNRALTPQEVLQNYNATKSRYGL